MNEIIVHKKVMLDDLFYKDPSTGEYVPLSSIADYDKLTNKPLIATSKSARKGYYISFSGTDNAGIHALSLSNGGVAIGIRSFSIGSYSSAVGVSSNAMNVDTTAYGTASHAEGVGFITTFPSLWKVVEAYTEGATEIYLSNAVPAGSLVGSESIEAVKVTSCEEVSSGVYKLTLDVGYPYDYAVDEDIFRLRSAAGNYSHSEGYASEASGESSHSEGSETTARGNKAHAEGSQAIAYGEASHAEGSQAIAYGEASHAEGNGLFYDDAYMLNQSYDSSLSIQVKALNIGHAAIKPVKGYCLVCKASLETAVIEEVEDLGNNVYNLTLSKVFSTEFCDGAHFNVFTGAYGAYSHVEGNLTDAIGEASHAEGYNTRAQNLGEHASGKFNKSTKNSTLYSVGFGTNEASRKNAFEITTDGNVYVYGLGNYDGTTTQGATPLANIAGGVPGITVVNTYSYKVGYDAVVGQSTKWAYAYGTSTASANYAVAEGNGTHAEGVASHSEGLDTRAVSDNSHAEGNGKVVIMLAQAYTQGDLTIVTDVPYPVNTELESPRTQERVSVVSVQESQGVYICTLAQAFSENIATNQPLNVYGGALGENSHAEGCGTIAASYATHAEGYGTIASGVYAKASGEKSYALGRASEATGQGTQVLNEAEFATGAYNKSTSGSTRFSVGIGADAQHRKNAYEVTSDGKIYVYGLGNYDGTNASVTGILDLVSVIVQGGGGVTSYDDLTDKPLFKRTGEDGWVLGDLTDPDCPHAYDDNSFAEGWGTVAGDPRDEHDGYAAHAEGDRTQASSQGSHSEGCMTQALALADHAEGLDSIASGGGSHAEGYTTKATTPHSHAEGDHSETHGTAAHAEGNATKANGDYSHSEGDTTTANGEASHAEGKSVTASGDYSHAEGTTTTASGEASHVEGSETTASGHYSHAEGDGSTASGEASHAEGKGSRASGTYSHAEGRYTYAAGAQSHAGGYSTQAEGENSHAEGYNTTALSNNGFVCGVWNYPDSTTLFAVGCGTSPNPKDAVHVDYDGNVYIQGIGGYTGANLNDPEVMSVQAVIQYLMDHINV